MTTFQAAAMHIDSLLCFGATPGQGNRALVISDDGGGTPAARQAYASTAGASACVFIDQDPAGITLDYYYPHTRSPLCLHATLAAAALLFAARPDADRLTVQTALRGQVLQLRRDGAGYLIGLAPQAIAPMALAPSLAATLLAAPGIVLAAAPVVASVGSPKLLLQVQDRATLHGLQPDLARISAWGQAHGVNGCYAYCRLDDQQFEGRNFNHLDPRREDSATGVAAGALASHLGQDLILFQGAAIGQPCRIAARLEGGLVLVGGRSEFERLDDQ